MVEFGMITFTDSLLALPKRATVAEWKATYERLVTLETRVNTIGSFWCKTELDRLAKARKIAWEMFN